MSTRRKQQKNSLKYVHYTKKLNNMDENPMDNSIKPSKKMSPN
jgi:hypothetical protein